MPGKKRMKVNNSVTKNTKASASDEKKLTQAFENLEDVGVALGAVAPKAAGELINSAHEISDDMKESGNIQGAVDEVQKIIEEAEQIIENKIAADQRTLRGKVKGCYGNTSKFIGMLDEYSGKTKGNDAYLESKDLSNLFGEDSGLKVVCNYESKYLKKMSSTYRKYCNKIFKYYQALGTAPANGEKASAEYIKKYDNFIDKSSKLASKYLKDQGNVKLNRLIKVQAKIAKGKYNLGSSVRDYAVDACKIAFMCLVAACSKDKARSDKAVNMFKNNKDVFQKILK